ncbi:MAG: hypothetical protein RBS80_18265 [Thermoguttaceae bacterium]|jgi:hypothetical protein|nr:hypothetical protein [Thermoguttaceae bacterium]
MDATALLARLDSREISDRIDRLTAERKALITLLRAARARERASRARHAPDREEGRRDD